MTPAAAGPQGRPLVIGSGSPTTLFVHGLAGSAEETRPFGSGVGGRRVFVTLRGHGSAPLPPGGGWTYVELARDVRAAADATGATRALGVSMGAGALLALATVAPDRFDRLVLVLPAALDRPRGLAVRERLARAAERVEAGDVDGLTAALLAEEPAAVRSRPEVAQWARRRAERLVGTPVAGALRCVPGLAPVADRAALRAVTAPVLVIAVEGDDAHPVNVAREVAAALPAGRLEVLSEGGVLWTHRRAVRDLVSGFLS